MSSKTTITFNANENLSMEQEIIPSHMQILTHHFESTNPLHIRRAKIIALTQNPGQKESDYIQAFHHKLLMRIYMLLLRKKFLCSSVFPDSITNMFAGNSSLDNKHLTSNKF